MRITAHFANTRPRLGVSLAVLAWGAALALFAAAAWLGAEGMRLRDEQPRLELRRSRAAAQLAGAGTLELPPAAELAALRERVQALNKVSSLRGWSTPQFLGWLAAQLPEDVYLVSLLHRPREGEALLVAESPSAEALTAFLLRLEREPRFAEVLLAKQGARQLNQSGSGQNGGAKSSVVQFEIRVRWKT
jgi:hypothetical protein